MIEVKDVSLDVLSYEDNVKRCERLGWDVVPVPLREIKDCNGNVVPVITCTGKVNLSAIVDVPDDTPLACKVANIETGHSFQWVENENYIGLLDSLIGKEGYVYPANIKGRGFTDVRIVHNVSEIGIIVRAIDGQPLACTNYKEDGEGFCYWVHPDYRRSESMLFYKTIVFSCALKYGYLCKGLSEVYGLVYPENIASNKSHYSLGYKFDGKVIVNGKEWNRYSQSIALLIKNAERFSEKCGVSI
jgi:hypothetical protein